MSHIYRQRNKESLYRARQMQFPLHTQISALPPTDLLLFHFYHHHIFIPEMVRWETKVKDSNKY